MSRCSGGSSPGFPCFRIGHGGTWGVNLGLQYITLRLYLDMEKGFVWLLTMTTQKPLPVPNPPGTSTLTLHTTYCSLPLLERLQGSKLGVAIPKP